MSGGQVKELLRDDTFLHRCIVALLTALLALVSYDYRRVTGDYDERLKGLATRFEQSDAANTTRTERLIAVEGHVARLKEDIARLSGDFRALGDKLGDKLDRLLEQRRQ